MCIRDSVYSSKNPDAGQELGRILKLFTENYNIKNVVLEGNSNGTSISVYYTHIDVYKRQ